eukprot:gene12394-biopygen9447
MRVHPAIRMLEEWVCLEWVRRMGRRLLAAHEVNFQEPALLPRMRGARGPPWVPWVAETRGSRGPAIDVSTLRPPPMRRQRSATHAAAAVHHPCGGSSLPPMRPWTAAPNWLSPEWPKRKTKAKAKPKAKPEPTPKAKKQSH